MTWNGGQQRRSSRGNKASTNDVLPAPTKEVRTEEGDSWSVILFRFAIESILAFSICVSIGGSRLERVAKTTFKGVGSELTPLTGTYNDSSRNESWQYYL